MGKKETFISLRELCRKEYEHEEDAGTGDISVKGVRTRQNRANGA